MPLSVRSPLKEGYPMSSAGRRCLCLCLICAARACFMFVQVMDVYTRYRLGHVLGLPETCQFQVGVLSALLRKYRTFLPARHESLARQETKVSHRNKWESCPHCYANGAALTSGLLPAGCAVTAWPSQQFADECIGAAAAAKAGEQRAAAGLGDGHLSVSHCRPHPHLRAALCVSEPESKLSGR